ncbi:MAG: GIY-YIG nuclease family protein [Xanthobacteraceae bacterium]
MAERIGVKEAAAILGEPIRTVQAMAASGKIPSAAQILSRRWTFDEATLRAWAAKRGGLAHLAELKAQRDAADAAEQAALDPYRGWKLYVIRCGRRVKIGITRDIRDRFRTLQSSNPHPLELLSVKPGDAEIEAMAHARFAQHRRRGEWFAYSDEIRKWIREGCW